MSKRIIKWTIICVALSVFTGVLAYISVRHYLPRDLNFNPNEPEETKGNISEEAFPDWPARERNKALAVVLDNSPDAYPQSGLEAAELIYEVPVEGGLTRFLAIIAKRVEILGPIRSTRPYINDLAKEYGAILVHAGGSPEALTNLERGKNEHLDEINGSKAVQGAFWRTPDRPKPSNLYSSTEALYKAAESEKYNLQKSSQTLPLLAQGQEVGGNPIKDITIFYPNRQAEARYVYNEKSKLFERYTAGKPHLSTEGEQLQAANVIVQFVHYRYLDGDGRLQLLMHGEGDTLIFREGKVIEAKWRKIPGDFTSYVNSKGEEIGLLPGPTWIQIVTTGTKVDY